jgi:site-specific recombinase XerD
MNNFIKYLHSRSYRLSTIHGYENGAKLFLKWCAENKINPKEVTYNHVLDYLESVQQRTQNKSTQGHKLQSVKMYYNFLIQQSEVDSNPVKDLRIRNTVKRMPKNILSFKKLQEIYQSCTGEGTTGKRNKMMLGLMIYQGVGAGELSALEVKDVNIHEGKIYIPSVGRTNSRTLKLEAHQVIEIQNYIKQNRPLLIAMNKKRSDKLFISAGNGRKLNNTCSSLMGGLRKIHPEIKNIQQIRASVISHWLKQYHIRQVQYMTGHRYVSSTQTYSTKKTDTLQEQLEKLMPEI